MVKWYTYKKNGTKAGEGPFTVEELQKQFGEGTIHSDTLIWNGLGKRDWRPLQTWNSLFLEVLSKTPKDSEKIERTETNVSNLMSRIEHLRNVRDSFPFEVTENEMIGRNGRRGQGGLLEEEDSYQSFSNSTHESSGSGSGGSSSSSSAINSRKIDSFSPRGDPILPDNWSSRTHGLGYSPQSLSSSSSAAVNWETRKRKTARNQSVRSTLRRNRTQGIYSPSRRSAVRGPMLKFGTRRTKSVGDVDSLASKMKKNKPEKLIKRTSRRKTSRLLRVADDEMLSLDADLEELQLLENELSDLQGEEEAKDVESDDYDDNDDDVIEEVWTSKSTVKKIRPSRTYFQEYGSPLADKLPPNASQNGTGGKQSRAQKLSKNANTISKSSRKLTTRMQGLRQNSTRFKDLLAMDQEYLQDQQGYGNGNGNGDYSDDGIEVEELVEVVMDENYPPPPNNL